MCVRDYIVSSLLIDKMGSPVLTDITNCVNLFSNLLKLLTGAYLLLISVQLVKATEGALFLIVLHNEG